MCRLGQIYINDAFATSHRPHSSIVGVDMDVKAAGLLMKRELEEFALVLENPKRPLVVFIGGSKVADKLPLLENLLDIADEIIIGGAFAFAFLKVHHSVNIGDSLFDESAYEFVPKIMKKAIDRAVKIHLPIDLIAANEMSNSADAREVSTA